MGYLMGIVECGYDEDAEYCFDILDYSIYTSNSSDTDEERKNAIDKYQRTNETMKTPTFIAYTFNSTVYFDVNVLRYMFEPLKNESFYRIAIGYADDTDHIHSMIVGIGDILISSDYPQSPPGMAGIPWDIFLNKIYLNPAVRKHIPSKMVGYLKYLFSVEKNVNL